MAPVDLVALLRQHGVFTFLVIDGSRPHVAAFAAGWDAVAIVSPAGDGTPMELTLDAVQAALDRWAREPHGLLWVELATLRLPWDLPDDFRGRYFDAETEEDEGPLLNPPSGLLDAADDTLFLRWQRSYAGAVAYLDAGLGLLAEELEQRGLLSQTLLLLTSDYGLPLGEHGPLGLARPWLHDELIHVPLILHLPGAAEAGRRVSALTQPVDLAPTLLDAFGVPLPPLHGRSLLPLARGEVEKVRDYACTGVEVDGVGEWALRTPDLAVLLPLDPQRPPQLYVKPDDRWEVNDLRQHHLEEAEQLERILRVRPRDAAAGAVAGAAAAGGRDCRLVELMHFDEQERFGERRGVRPPVAPRTGGLTPAARPLPTWFVKTHQEFRPTRGERQPCFPSPPERTASSAIAVPGRWTRPSSG